MSTEMSSVRITEPLYYHREYGNDVAQWQRIEVPAADPYEEREPDSWTNSFARVAACALPFVSLYRPAAFPLSLGLNGVRTVSSLAKLSESLAPGQLPDACYPPLVETGVSAIALASTVFAHPLGMLVTTGHDLLSEVVKLAKLYQAERYDETLESLLKIANDTLYFGLFIVGGVELAIASISLQILLCLYQTRKEIREEKYLEAACHFAMACVRGSQLYDQAQVLRLKWEIENLLSSVAKSDGLGEAWQFPSDHLPVGAKVGNANILSWNVLNKNFISWVYDNSQGLNGSMLTQMDTPSEANPKLTLREELVILYIHEMIASHQNLILTLQECHPEFAKALVSSLPSHMGVISTDRSFSAVDIDLTIYDKTRFYFLEKESSIVSNVFANSDVRKQVSDSLFQEIATGQRFQVVNVHIPGDPTKPGREEFAKYLLSHARPDAVTIGIGDMNFREHEMQAALDKMAGELDTSSSFVNLAHYNTNISPYTFEGKSIDHIWISTKQFNLRLQSLKADEVLFGLQQTVDLLAEERRSEEQVGLAQIGA